MHFRSHFQNIDFVKLNRRVRILNSVSLCFLGDNWNAFNKPNAQKIVNRDF